MKRIRNKGENTIDMAYKGVLYPNANQRTLIAKTLGCCRFVFNRFLNERKTVYKNTGKSLSYVDQCKELPKMKLNPDTIWLNEVDSTALQNTVRNLEDSFDNYFLGLEKGRKVEYPKFKRKHDYTQSYRSTFVNNNIRFADANHIQLPKLGLVKCKFPMKVEGVIKNATVTRESDGTYSVSLMCEVPKPEIPEKTGKAVGIDLGIKTLAVTSDGKEYDNPRTFSRNRKKLAREQRKLSRKTKGGKNYAKQRKKVAKVHKKIRNQRLDASHKMTRELVNQYDVICIENLNVSGMKRSKLAREISDASWGEIRRQLNYKSEWAGKKLITIDKWYPSSQTCSECGFINREVKDLKIRQWKCPNCGTWHDRDANAAKNILEEGLRTIG